MFSKNKITSHNIVTIPVITPTCGTHKRAKKELQSIDIKTRKLLTSTGSFHIISDIDTAKNYHAITIVTPKKVVENWTVLWVSKYQDYFLLAVTIKRTLVQHNRITCTEPWKRVTSQNCRSINPMLRYWHQHEQTA